ncbi:MAG TPA: choice-of-anchor B family protein [Nocardioidaceae bacterium]|nr:choice-of-anchor B family protein [Nocardioidaceae bacterium]
MSVRLMNIRWLAAGMLVLSLLATAVPAGAHGGDPDDGKSKSALMSMNLSELDRAASMAMGSAECEDGMAAIFPCKNVDLASFLPLEAIGGGTGNDIWGWTDPATGRELAIMGTSNGTAFVDVTDPQNPVFLGHMPTQSPLVLPLWRDIKVYDNHVFVVSEHDNHGMQVFDLTRLRAPSPTKVFTPDAVYEEFSNAHNVAINTETGFAYAVGSDTCDAGLHMINIQDPKNPTFAGCFSADGYTHDVQCVVYRGSDGRFRGREICFASNEDTVTVVDVSDKQNPVMLSRTGYDTAAYTHQGSLTPDHRWFLFGDEGDESSGTVPNTTTYIMEMGRLTDPGPPQAFHHETPSIDHNLYISDRLVTESNYTAGVRMLEYDKFSLRDAQLNEVAFFDVVPGSDATEFAGTWSNYTFGSGTVVASTIESGLFVLRPQLPEGGRKTAGPR